MRPDLVVVPSPRLDFAPGILQGQEPIYAQAFVPQLSMEGLGKGVVRGLSRPGEVQRHPVLVGPPIHGLRVELGTIVTANPLRGAAPVLESFQKGDDLLPPEARRHLDPQALPAKIIDYRQDPEPPPVEELVRHEVHAPALVRSPGLGPLAPDLGAGAPPGAFGPQVQAFLAVEPPDPLVVHPPALPAEEDVDPLVAPADPDGVQLPDPHPQGGLRGGLPPVAVARAGEAEGPAGPPLRDPEALGQEVHQGAPLRRP